MFDKVPVCLTCEGDLCQRKDGGHDVGEDPGEVLGRQVRQAEQQQVEDDAGQVERDQGHQDVQEGALQVHVVRHQHHDRQDVACKQKETVDSSGREYNVTQKWIGVVRKRPLYSVYEVWLSSLRDSPGRPFILGACKVKRPRRE